MELSPDLLANVTFQEQWRGYSPDQVHDFLARVGNGVRDLQDRLRDTEEKLRAAESRATDLADADEIRRTLVLAQRTATAAVEEARAEAERLMADAEAAAAETRRSADEASFLRRREAETTAAEAMAAAEVAAAGIVSDAERRLSELEAEIERRRHDELEALAGQRAELEADVDALEAFAADGRSRLRAELEAQLEALDVAGLGERPALAPMPTFAAPEVDDAVDDDRAGDHDAEASAADEAPDDDEPPDRAHDAHGEPHATAADDWATGEPAADPSSTGPPTAAMALFDDELDVRDEAPAPDPDDDEELDWAAPSALSDPVLERTRAELAEALRDAGALLEPLGDDPGPPADGPDRVDDTGEVPLVTGAAPPAPPASPPPTRVIADEPEDDPFLTELRRAVTDNEPLGPREHQPTGEVPVIEAPDGSRFRLRRHR